MNIDICLTDPRAKRTSIDDVYNLLSVGFMKGTSGFLKAGGGEQKGGGMINREVRVGFTHVSIKPQYNIGKRTLYASIVNKNQDIWIKSEPVTDSLD